MKRVFLFWAIIAVILIVGAGVIVYGKYLLNKSAEESIAGDKEARSEGMTILPIPEVPEPPKLPPMPKLPDFSVPSLPDVPMHIDIESLKAPADIPRPIVDMPPVNVTPPPVNVTPPAP